MKLAQLLRITSAEAEQKRTERLQLAYQKMRMAEELQELNERWRCEHESNGKH